jgi:uncharacterized protein YbjT (DUF2867 family)
MILVVGATGTLGRRLVPALVPAGEPIRALVRPPASRLDVARVDVVEGDLLDPISVERALHGVRTVVCAVSGFGGRAGADVRGVDGEGTRRLLGSAATMGVEHLVLVSAFDAGPGHPLELQREKFRSEEALRQSGIGWTIVRPAPSMQTWAQVIGGRLPGGKALVLGRGDNPISFVAAEDVAWTVVEAVEAGPTARIIELTGPEDLTAMEVVERMGSALGRKLEVMRIPRAALRAQAVFARPFRPVMAWQARAALLMDTADMRYRPPGCVVGARRFDQILAADLARSA